MIIKLSKIANFVFLIGLSAQKNLSLCLSLRWCHDDGQTLREWGILNGGYVLSWILAR